jgi:putative aminopeptidase FrvX
MRDQSMQFFERLVEAAGPSGDERLPARVWREYASGFAEARHDALGSSFVSANDEGSPRVAVFGHIDEIGLVINHIDDNGYLWFGTVGGWDPEVLVGQRVRILGRGGAVPGVIGKKSRHHQDADDRDKQSKVRDLWIDVGATDAKDAATIAGPGDLAVLEQPVVRLANGRLVTRAADNRCGAFVAAEAVRLYLEAPAQAAITGVATVGEETSFLGAYTTGYSVAPDVAIAVDVTNATDYPSTSKEQYGRVEVGKGPALLRGGATHPLVFEGLRDAAEAEGIPYQVEPVRGDSGTDLDAVRLTRGGVPGGVVSIPLRHMHSPNELLDPDDLEACAVLVAAYARRLTQAPTAE